MSTSAVVAYTATTMLPVATRTAGQSAVALPQRERAAVSDAGRTGDPVVQVLPAAAARTRSRSPTLGTLIDTWA